MSDLGHGDASGASDDQLIAEARAGGRVAFAELWNRHYAVAASTARQLSQDLDADDVVAEAFTRIYDRIAAGGGPTGAFRPYLYAVVRNIVARWGSTANHEVSTDVHEEWDTPLDHVDETVAALERSLTARAFRSLPERWQTVLWYTEVEGLDPHEVAPLMGLTANGVAALSYRARDGLRTAWLQAHVSDSGVAAACSRTVAHLGEYSRKTLSARESRLVEGHLQTCSRCSILADELDDVASHLSLVLLPLILGGAAGALTSLSGPPTSATAAAAVPALPAHVGASAAAAVGSSAAAAVTGTAVVVIAPLLISVAVLAGMPASGQPGGQDASVSKNSAQLVDESEEAVGATAVGESARRDAEGHLDGAVEDSSGIADEAVDRLLDDIPIPEEGSDLLDLPGDAHEIVEDALPPISGAPATPLPSPTVTVPSVPPVPSVPTAPELGADVTDAL